MSEPIPVLTLWQPWASLVALGVKTIETRSWSTEYRGPLAIHAAVRPVGRCSRCNGGGLVAPGSCCPECGGDGRHELMGAYWDHAVEEPPLGAILATCTLVDVVPIVQGTDCLSPSHVAVDSDDDLWRCDCSPDGVVSTHIVDQLPYGDFTPGRFAWLLADFKALPEPVPFKGGQRLTRKWAP